MTSAHCSCQDTGCYEAYDGLGLCVNMKGYNSAWGLEYLNDNYDLSTPHAENLCKYLGQIYQGPIYLSVILDNMIQKNGPVLSLLLRLQ